MATRLHVSLEHISLFALLAFAHVLDIASPRDNYSSNREWEKTEASAYDVWTQPTRDGVSPKAGKRAIWLEYLMESRPALASWVLWPNQSERWWKCPDFETVILLPTSSLVKIDRTRCFIANGPDEYNAMITNIRASKRTYVLEMLVRIITLYPLTRRIRARITLTRLLSALNRWVKTLMNKV